MKVGSQFGGVWLTGIAPVARAAEQLGYDFIWTTEVCHDSMLAATMAAAATENLEIHTALTIAFPRSPTVLAMEAWDIQELSRGRFVLGVGSQVKSHNQNRFSVNWGPPAPRMKEYIQMVKAVWNTFQTGEIHDFIGEYYRFSLMTPRFNPGPVPYPQPKIFLGAVGDAMARVAGEVADGLLAHRFTTDRYMREVVLPNVAIGLSRSGRTWQDLEITASGLTVFAENESEIEQKLQELKQPIAFYGSTRTYHEVFALHGLADLGMQLHAMSLQGKWAEMERVISEDVLRMFAETSTYEKLPEFTRTRREYASRIDLSLPVGTPADRERARHIIREVQEIHSPSVPREILNSAGSRLRGSGADSHV